MALVFAAALGLRYSCPMPATNQNQQSRVAKVGAKKTCIHTLHTGQCLEKAVSCWSCQHCHAPQWAHLHKEAGEKHCKQTNSEMIWWWKNDKVQQQTLDTNLNWHGAYKMKHHMKSKQCWALLWHCLCLGPSIPCSLLLLLEVHAPLQVALLQLHHLLLHFLQLFLWPPLLFSF